MRKRLATLFIITVLCVSMFGVFLPLVHAEPTLDSIFDGLGFSARTLVNTQTFPPGTYNFTLLAEYAGWADYNALGWYPAGTPSFNAIFTGTENTGFIATVTINTQFGIAFYTPGGMWYSETSFNSDGDQHAKVYQSQANPALY